MRRWAGGDRNPWFCWKGLSMALNAVLFGGYRIKGDDGLLVCNFPLNKKRWLTFPSISQWMYCITVLKIWWIIMDWSPFVIWFLFNLFKGFCIQKFTFLCIFFLCKNWCNMCIKLYVLSVYSVTKWFFFLSFGCINKSCCEVASLLV